MQIVPCLQECVGVPEAVAGLCFHRPISQFLGQHQRHLVVLGSLLEFTQEDVRIAQIAVSSPLGTAVTELLGNLQPLLVVVDGLSEVPQEVVDVSQVAARSSLLIGGIVYYISLKCGGGEPSQAQLTLFGLSNNPLNVSRLLSSSEVTEPSNILGPYSRLQDNSCKNNRSCKN